MNISLQSNVKEIFTKKRCIEVLEKMHLSRFLDKKMSILVKQNKGTTFFLSSQGHEMVGVVGGMSFIPKKDWVFPYYRDKSFVIGLGGSIEDIMTAFLAREGKNHSKGRMMLDHFSDPTLRIPCQSSCVGSQFLQAVGRAKAISIQGRDEVVYVSAGDGATSQGDFHEALNFSCIHNLPIVFVIQDNRYAISVTAKEQTAGAAIEKVAKGYEGLDIFTVDGTNFFQINESFEKAILKARSNKGPSLIVAKVARLNSHTISDDQNKYKDEKTILEEKKKDPIAIFEEYLINEGILTKEEIERKKEKIIKEIENISINAEKVPFPKKEDVESFVFKPFSFPEAKSKKRGDPIVMMDGLNKALIEEMEKDPHIIVFGQDVAGKKGGVFGITKNLTDKFGKDRCFNTPLAESTIVGVAIGMAFDGMHKVVAEIQFIDYVWTGINQLVNELASIHYRSAGQWHCPIVIRMPYGGYIQGGPYHSQSIEAIFTHIPGLKVVVPSNACDAKRLLKSAIIDPNPVIFLEHKSLYRQQIFAKNNEPTKDEYLPFGKAKVVKKGKDITLVAWGLMVAMSYEVANKFEKQGISVEVIDLRTLVPLDFECVLQSLKKTSKLLIVHEAAMNCGFGAELAARAANEGFCYLDAPVKRVCAKNCPISYCKDLEDATLPQLEDIETAIVELNNF